MISNQRQLNEDNIILKQYKDLINLPFALIEIMINNSESIYSYESITSLFLYLNNILLSSPTIQDYDVFTEVHNQIKI